MYEQMKLCTIESKKSATEIVEVQVIFCKEYQEYIYLNPHPFWNVNDLDVKCKNCDTINTITLENGELRKQV
jgi:hypothetical protein